MQQNSYLQPPDRLWLMSPYTPLIIAGGASHRGRLPKEELWLLFLASVLHSFSGTSLASFTVPSVSRGARNKQKNDCVLRTRGSAIARRAEWTESKGNGRLASSETLINRVVRSDQCWGGFFLSGSLSLSWILGSGCRINNNRGRRRWRREVRRPFCIS